MNDISASLRSQSCQRASILSNLAETHCALGLDGRRADDGDSSSLRTTTIPRRLQCAHRRACISWTRHLYLFLI